ncbi:lymphocyte function-associated antigen 3-like isoform X1 [Arapaima gigas]
MPSPLEYLSYNCNFMGIFAGPTCSYNDYAAFTLHNTAPSNSAPIARVSAAGNGAADGRRQQRQPPEAVYGLTGEEVELDPKVREPLVSIRWNKVLPIADWYTGGIQSYYYRCAAVDQCDLSLTTGVLKMKGLKAEDDGRYSVEINMKGIAREFDLVVLGKLPFTCLWCNK